MANRSGHFNGVTVEGLDELLKAMNKLPIEAMEYAKEGSNKSAEIVMNSVKTRAAAHRLSGDLEQSLKIGKAKRSAKYPKRVFAKIYPNKQSNYYIRALELGHPLIINSKKVKVVAQTPILRPATDVVEPQVYDVLIDSINKALEQFGGTK